MDAGAKPVHDGAMFTLAHLSDPHLAPLPRPRWHELLNKRVTGFINWQRKRRFVHNPIVLAALVADLKAAKPDHIAITGDFVNIALRAEFDHARAWLEAIGPAESITAIPGNHDAYIAGTLAIMQRAVGGYMRGDGSGEYPFVRKRGPVALIGLSSAVPTLPFMATGRLGDAQIGRLAAQLGQLAQAGLFRVVLIHHPPVSRQPAHKRLTDASEFLRAIAAQGAELIIHGHDHVQALVWLDGPHGRVPAIGVPSASAAPGDGESAAYNLYRIGGEPGAWRCDMEMRGTRADGSIAALKRVTLIG